MIPALSRLRDDPDRLRRWYSKLLRIVTFVTLPPMCSLALCADDVVYLVAGPQWTKAADILRVLGPVGALQVGTATIDWLLLSQGQARRSLCLGGSPNDNLARMHCSWSSMGCYGRRSGTCRGNSRVISSQFRVRGKEYLDPSDRCYEGLASELCCDDRYGQCGIRAEGFRRARLESNCTLAGHRCGDHRHHDRRGSIGLRSFVLKSSFSDIKRDVNAVRRASLDFLVEMSIRTERSDFRARLSFGKKRFGLRRARTCGAVRSPVGGCASRPNADSGVRLDGGPHQFSSTSVPKDHCWRTLVARVSCKAYHDASGAG